MILVLSCEHAVNHVPKKYHYLFAENPSVLETHEAYDPGTLDLFSELKDLSEIGIVQKISRLVVETNRSLGHSKLFSRFSSSLSAEEKHSILKDYYEPYRDSIFQSIRKIMGSGEVVLHISLHSFTPVLMGEIRRCDIGLLYDPGRILEKQFCHEWKKLLAQSGLKIRYNYPYQGKADGLTTSLRRQFTERYLGIELEVNQKFVSKNSFSPDMKQMIKSSLQQLLKKAS